MRRIKLGLVLAIVVQTIVYLVAGANKAYIHMDEAYSLALAQYDKIDITANTDFYNTWHTSEYYQDYLAVQEKDQGNWWPVYENQKNDVHPPLYYLLLRGIMELTPGRFSKWPGIILNIVIMAGCTVFLYLILCKLLAKEKNVEWKALALALAAGLTVAGVSTVVYIRMYALLELMVLATLWLHLKWREQAHPGMGWYVAIGVVAVLGVLTQYYYLFFLMGLALVVMVQDVRQKNWRDLAKYLGSLVVAGVLVLIIWPHILQHMFFGYRGQGVLSNLVNPVVLLQHLWNYFWIVDYNVFHRTLILLILVVVMVALCKLFENYLAAGTGQNHGPSVARDSILRVPPNSKTIYKAPRAQLQVLNLVLWPTVVYFVLAAVASPYMELRYIMPVCGLIFALVFYGLHCVLKDILAEKWCNIVMTAVVLVTLLVAPVQIGFGWMRVELLYRDRQAVMTAVTENPEAPILYFITTENNRFLDNILPFAEAQESYLALDLLNPTAQDVKEILVDKDLSRGLFVFISTSQDQEKALTAVRQATGLDQVDYVQGVNTCGVYYLH